MNSFEWQQLPRVLSTRQAARALGVRYDHARVLVTGGLLPAYLMSQQWVIFRDEVEARLNHADGVSSFGLIPEPDLLAELPAVLTRGELAEFFDISLNTATAWMQSGIVTALHRNGRWVINAEDLREDLDRNSNRHQLRVVRAELEREVAFR